MTSSIADLVFCVTFKPTAAVVIKLSPPLTSDVSFGILTRGVGLL